VHAFGGFFKMAMWEVLNNHVCEEPVPEAGTDCATDWGRTDGAIGWTGRGQARVGVAKAMAFATNVSGGNSTYDEFAALMAAYLSDHYGSALAGRFRSVMEHHGLDL
jgi:hypothetical protein